MFAVLDHYNNSMVIQASVASVTTVIGSASFESAAEAGDHGSGSCHAACLRLCR
jgi:hypothetical protein